jgi:hypothetical protein
MIGNVLGMDAQPRHEPYPYRPADGREIPYT